MQCSHRSNGSLWLDVPCLCCCRKHAVETRNTERSSGWLWLFVGPCAGRLQLKWRYVEETIYFFAVAQIHTIARIHWIMLHSRQLFKVRGQFSKRSLHNNVYIGDSVTRCWPGFFASLFAGVLWGSTSTVTLGAFLSSQIYPEKAPGLS